MNTTADGITSQPPATVKAGHHEISTELAAEFFARMIEDAPRLFGYYMGWAVSGQAPDKPATRQRRGAPDR